MTINTTMGTESVYWIEDPGHAWLAVSLEVYPQAYDYGTGFGYEDGKFIYLEEDVEAPAFMVDHPDIAERSSAGGLGERRYDFDAPVRRFSRNMAMLDVDRS
jgi:hypothetical protein